MSLDLVRDIARAVRDAGGEALIVGGWVRDRLLGFESKDFDLEVYGLGPARLRSLLEAFGPVNTVGESFTVYKLGPIDVALPRRESKVGRGHRGFEVTGDPGLAYAEASRRRDFTINAIAWNPLSEEYIDPHGGRRDLERRLLRAVDLTTFGDDSLRVLRAVQFAARFDFVLDPDTRTLCQSIPLDDLPAERIWGEVEKLLLKARRPSIGFALALDLGVIDRLLPELRTLVGCVQEPAWHPEGDVWIHTLLVLDEARARIEHLDRPRALVVMLGALCHDLGKPLTTAVVDGRIRSFDHEAAGVAPTLGLLDRLRLHSVDGLDVRREVSGIVAHHLKPGMFHQARETIRDSAFKRLAQKVDLELLAIVAKADCLGRRGAFNCSGIDWFLAKARALGVEHAPPVPLIKGRHLVGLGLEPGPRVGEILKQVYERQLEGDVRTEDEALRLARQLLSETRGQFG